MKNFNEFTPANGPSIETGSEPSFLSDDQVENQIELNQDHEIDFLLDQCSGDLYMM